MDELTQKMIERGLEIPGAGPPSEHQQLLVNVQNPDGSTTPVPVEMAQFMALDQLLQATSQLMLRLDAIHHHLKSGAGSNSRKTCLLCSKQNEVAQQMEARVKAMEDELHHPHEPEQDDGPPTEESQEKIVSDDSTGEV